MMTPKQFSKVLMPILCYELQPLLRLLFFQFALVHVSFRQTWFRADRFLYTSEGPEEIAPSLPGVVQWLSLSYMKIEQYLAGCKRTEAY